MNIYTVLCAKRNKLLAVCCALRIKPQKTADEVVLYAVVRLWPAMLLLNSTAKGAKRYEKGKYPPSKYRENIQIWVKNNAPQRGSSFFFFPSPPLAVVFFSRLSCFSRLKASPLRKGAFLQI
jgi:hypothetical protein